MTIKKVVLDAGHGGKDSGAVGNGLQEKNIVLKIVQRTKEILEKNYKDVQVLLTRNSDVFIELGQRASYANNANANLFVSVHINSANISAQGFETFIHDGTSSATTKSYQKKIHDAIMKRAPYFSNRGTKTANYQVLRSTKMPAILTESGFISNESDASVLKDSKKLENICLGHAEGIASALGLVKKNPVPPSVNDEYVYKIQVGAYDDKKMAENILSALTREGYKNCTIISEKQ